MAGSLVLGVPGAGAATRPPTAPPGYHLIRSGPIPLRPDRVLDTGGSITCPTGTVPWGGGAGFTGGTPGVGENVNTSAPSGNGWRARYNNANGRPNDDFAVVGICANAPQGYTTQFSAVDNPPMTQVSAVAMCPTGTVLLGGGVLSTSDSVNAFATSAFPRGPHAYAGSMWNGTARDEKFDVFAICGAKPPGYTIVRSSETLTVAATTDIASGASCPKGTSLISGGVNVTNARPTVNIGAAIPESRSDLLSELLTATSGTVSATTSVICAA